MSQITLYFVRHGLTRNNAKGVVQGRCDALLSQEGRRALTRLRKAYDYPAVDRIYCSPAIRAQETADILYPQARAVLLPGLWEYSFGEWEGRPMAEIAETPVFSKWLDQSPDCRFAGGESMLEASYRVRSAITRVIQDAWEEGLERVAVVAHGEIFSLLFQAVLQCDLDPEEYLLCPNGMGLVATVDPEVWFFQDQHLQFQSFFPLGAPRPKAEESPYFQKR